MLRLQLSCWSIYQADCLRQGLGAIGIELDQPENWQKLESRLLDSPDLADEKSPEIHYWIDKLNLSQIEQVKKAARDCHLSLKIKLGELEWVVCSHPIYFHVCDPSQPSSENTLEEGELRNENHR
jgi:hypothetical protein